jgi:NAD dependent epimerase/dehydratase family enzyme
VIPQKLVDAGYQFRYPELKPALVEIIAQRAR